MAEQILTIDLRDAMQMLGGVESRLSDATPLMKDVFLLGLRSTALNFQAQGRPTRWDELAPSTKARRRQGPNAGGGMRILQNFGLLLQSVGGGASGPFAEAGGFGDYDRESAVIGTNHPGAYNQWPNDRTGAPARVFMLWQSVDEEDAGAMQQDFVLGIGPYSSV